MEKMNVKPAEGKLGILVVGCGAVATTFMTGVFMTRKGLAKPVGSMTQYDKIRVGKGADKKYLHYKDIVPLADLNDIVFGTWDVYPQNAYQAAMYAEVLKEKDINPVREELEKVVPMKAAFDKNYAKRLDGDNVKDCKTRWEMVEALRQDIRDFKEKITMDMLNSKEQIGIKLKPEVEAELNDRQTQILEQANIPLTMDGRQVQLEPEDRSVAHVDGNALYELNEGKAWNLESDIKEVVHKLGYKYVAYYPYSEAFNNCTIVPNILLTISSSISQYACISPDKAIATYSIGLLSNNLCNFASDCSVVLRAASTSSHFIRNIFPSVNHTST